MYLTRWRFMTVRSESTSQSMRGAQRLTPMSVRPSAPGAEGVVGSHQPVLLDKVTQALRLRGDGIYVDATFGRGGHSGAILDRLGPAGSLFAFDKDPQACHAAWRRFGTDARFRIERGSFTQLAACLQREGVAGRVDGLLFDLGVSSPQLDDPKRGFSLRSDGPLDMRMDPEDGLSAADWLADADAGDIARVLRELGEERHARRIAAAIARARAEAPIKTTARLAEIVASVVPRPHGPGGRIHPATRTFMALRIYINGELAELKRVLPQALDALAPGGRLVVISFHSLEDRIVKRFMRGEARPAPDPLSLIEPPPARLKLCGKALHADAAEVADNPRARSAVMRVAEKVG